MKKWGLIFFIACFLIGCGQNEETRETEEKAIETNEEAPVEKLETVTTDKEKTQKTNTNTGNENKESSHQTEKNDTTNEPVAIQEIDSNFIKENIKIGMTEQELLSLLGAPFNKGISAKDAEPVWLYNIGSSKGYYFEEQELLKDQGVLDTVDIEGIKNKEIEMVVFVTWDNKKVSRVSHTYIREDGKVVTHYLFKDGHTKEDIHMD